ncbi:MAG: DUF1924 domain-containing protein [Gammaproteobacteria bacterium]|nr:DUF1924 domain-containing protein [Gammaproteobacteria bacterium]MDH5650606.1 DUF1924 domain-containing protein [Gammaproteobacteria bacterium]
MKHILFLLVTLFMSQTVMAGAVDDALAEYAGGKLKFDAKRGETLWNKTHTGKDGDRRCTSCHNKDNKQAGKHAKSGKSIEPMAPSVNSKRYTDLKKINKWFKRNCKWTVGRECTDQEKGDILTYLSTQ